MKDDFENTTEDLNFSEEELFTKIWFSPRQVFKYINDNRYDKYVTILLVFSGISRSFDRASSKNMGDNMSLWAIVGLAVIIGGLLGWISYYCYAALISWTGKWIKGQGNTDSILRILSYAMIPTIVALVFLIPQIGIYGIEIFKEDGDITSAGWISNTIVYISLALEFILGIWSIIFCVVGISEVQKLSIGKSILNLLLPVLVFAVPILLIVLAINGF